MCFQVHSPIAVRPFTAGSSGVAAHDYIMPLVCAFSTYLSKNPLPNYTSCGTLSVVLDAGIHRQLVY